MTDGLSDEDLVELAELQEQLDAGAPAPVRGRPPQRDGWTVRELASAPAPPSTRGFCTLMPRPCPALRCRQHLPRAALAHGESCALDVVDANPDGLTQEQVARYFGVTETTIANVENAALVQIRTAVSKPRR